MSFWRQLRWQMIVSHLIVVIVGVSILLLATRLTISNATSTSIQPSLRALMQAEGTVAIETSIDVVIGTFQEAVASSLSIAAFSSILAGIATSLWLTNQILRPLRQITQSSQRIADGHYQERVSIPNSDELAQVALNFNQMAESLEEIESQRIKLIGNVSHELRTPLTGIEGYLEGLMDGVIASDEETFAHMYQEVRRLRRLVDDLQSLSKVEAGHISLNVTTFDLIALVKKVVEQLQPQATAQALQMSTTCVSSAMIQADADRTAQILLNLIGNAIRYTAENGQITVHCSLKHRNVEVSIEDTGIGIPPEALPYIFERFYRVDPSRSRSSGGSGIGLTISRHLTWAMRGELTAHSNGLGHGTIFLLKLPLAEEFLAL